MRPWAWAVTGAGAIGVALLAVGVAGGLLVRSPARLATPYGVLYSQGEVIRVVTGPTADNGPPTIVDFSVPLSGARLVGSISWDHGSAVFLVGPVGSLWGCPAEFPSPHYGGSAYVQTFTEALGPGLYELGAICAGWGNATVTASIAVVGV